MLLFGADLDVNTRRRAGREYGPAEVDKPRRRPSAPLRPSRSFRERLQTVSNSGHHERRTDRSAERYVALQPGV